MSDLWFGLLGPTVVFGDAGEIVIHGTLRRKLLVRLLVAGNRAVPAERLREELWDGEPPASAASTLKSHVSLLRRALGEGRLSHRDAYVLHVADDELDAALFEGEARSGRELLAAGDAAGAAGAFGQGLARWRGPAVADAADTTWGGPEAVRLEQLRAAALEDWLEARLRLGEAAGVVADAEGAIAEHPLREGLWAKLIAALYGAGRQAEALRAYQRLREQLAEELGIDPSPDLVALEAAVLRQDLQLAAPPPARPTSTAEDVAGDTARSGPTQGNLPPELTSFVPRPRQLAELGRIVAGPGLVTLTGPGGTGKTRLALQAARAASGYEGVWMCDLSAVADGAQAPAELAAVVGCLGAVGADQEGGPVERLRDGAHLLVLDNCEHVLDEATALAHRLIASCPQLRVVATSRSPLGVAGESVYQVPPMSAPPSTDAAADPAALGEFESVRLLVERAASQRAGFALDASSGPAVASICARLEGIPLAVELAAARVRTMSVADIDRRLDDRLGLLTSGPRTAPARQRALRSLVDWSYDLLDEPERRALRRLSVFAGGFDLGAAEAVVSAAGEEMGGGGPGGGVAGGVAGGPGAVDTVSSLVDKSLVQLDPVGDVDGAGAGARYRMLETVREYAGGKLAEESAEAVAAGRAHSRFFLELVEEAAPHFAGGGQLRWRARLEPDHDNLRQAFAWLVAVGGAEGDGAAVGADGEAALRFGVAASKFWNSRGVYGDEVELFETAIDRSDAATDPATQADALNALGFLLFRRGEAERARRRLERALRVGRDLGSARLCADVLETLAWVADRRGDTDAAEELAKEAVVLALESGVDHLIARAYDVRAATRQYRDPGAARSDYAEALRFCAAAGDGPGQASTLNNLGILEIEQGDPAAARRAFSEALAIAGDVSDTGLLPYLEYGVGLAAALEEDHGPAEAAFGAALTGARRTGQRALVPYALLGLAVTGAGTGREEWGARLLGASRALFDELGVQPEQTEAGLDASAAKALADALGPRFEPCLQAGRRLTGGEVFELAAAGA